MQQIVRTLTMAEAGVVRQVLICDRGRKWSRDVRPRLRDAGIRVVLIPERAKREPLRWCENWRVLFWPSEGALPPDSRSSSARRTALRAPQVA